MCSITCYLVVSRVLVAALTASASSDCSLKMAFLLCQVRRFVPLILCCCNLVSCLSLIN